MAPVGDLKVAPIREFEVTSVVAMLHPIEKAAGAWKNGDYENYSAIAFAFAHKLYGELNVPIGILNCSFSQTAIQAWVPRVGVRVRARAGRGAGGRRGGCATTDILYSVVGAPHESRVTRTYRAVCISTSDSTTLYKKR